jgi:Regulator of ribonuclease activity B
MKNEYPEEDDGDALRLVEKSGADMSRPMTIEFAIAAPDVGSAQAIAEVVSARGFDPDIFIDDDDQAVSVYCGKSMMATYENVVAVQAELNELCLKYGAECDGWGTFGNTQVEG